MPCSPGMKACRRDCLHRAMVREYHDQRDAREALRESGALAPSAFSYGAQVSYSQLEDEDFAQAVPPVTFRSWLEGRAQARYVE